MNDHLFLSPAAKRLLTLLTPEHVPIGEHQATHPALQELVRAGMISTGWAGAEFTVRLTDHGRKLVHRHMI